MIRYNRHASVQGAILTLKARRFNFYPPTKHESLGFRVFKFKISDNSEAVIKKELSPKEAFWRQKISLLNSNDGIKGEIIRGFSERDPLRLKVESLALQLIEHRGRIPVKEETFRNWIECILPCLKWSQKF